MNPTIKDAIINNITEWLMLIITVIYALATIQIRKANQESAKAAKKSVVEARRQFNESLKESKRQFEENLKESQRQFDNNLKLQEQHNIDSVRPAVMIDFSSSTDGTAMKGRITITNHGLGPAILKELKFRKDEKVYKNSNGYCTIGDLIEMRIVEEKVQVPFNKIFMSRYTKEFRHNDKDCDYLAVNEEMILLEFKTYTKEESDIIGRIFDGVRMELVYTDLYDDDSRSWTIKKKLSYFKLNWKGSHIVENP